MNVTYFFIYCLQQQSYIVNVFQCLGDIKHFLTLNKMKIIDQYIQSRHITTVANNKSEFL